MNENIARSLCFTGHRPERLPKGEQYRLMLDTMYRCIDDAVENGYTTFYTGLADGIDYLAAEYLFRLRMQKPQIRIIGVQPCEDYLSFYRRRGYDAGHLDLMITVTDRIITLPGISYDPQCFLRRNCYMVDHSAAIIAVCSENGRSGSMQAFRYAVRKGLALCRVCLEDLPPSDAFPAPETLRVFRRRF